MSESPRREYSMTLLTSMLERPLDPGYAAAAARRQRSGGERARPVGTPIVALVAIAIGVLVTMAALRASGTDTAGARARADLVARVEAKRTATERLADQVSALQAEVSALESQAAGSGGPAAARAAALAVPAGAVAVSGPGLTITLDDAPGQDPGGAGADPRADAATDEGRVHARDLQLVVNDLWRAGAEAVAINGQRLTATSAIRFAGAAILVDYRPLERPYVLTALGAPKGFPATFADGPGGSYLATLRSTFDIRVDVISSPALTVPASVSLTTRYARPLEGPAGKDDT